MRCAGSRGQGSGFRMQAWASRNTTKGLSPIALMQTDEVICLLKRRQGIEVRAGPRFGRHHSGNGEKSKFLLPRAEFGDEVLDRARPKGLGPNSSFVFPMVWSCIILKVRWQSSWAKRDSRSGNPFLFPWSQPHLRREDKRHLSQKKGFP